MQFVSISEVLLKLRKKVPQGSDLRPLVAHTLRVLTLPEPSFSYAVYVRIAPDLGKSA